MTEPIARKVKAKIRRTVTEIAIVTLDKDGDIEDVEEVHDEVEWNDGEIISIFSVLSVYP